MIGLSVLIPLYLSSLIPSDTKLSHQLMWEYTQLKYPKATPSEASQRLRKLIQKSQLLRKHGHEVSMARVEKRAEQIGRQSQSSERLAKAVYLFRNHRQLYLELVVWPTMIDGEIYQKLYRAAESTALKRKPKASELLKQLQVNPQRWETIKTHGASERFSIEVSLEKGIRWSDHEDAHDTESDLTFWLQSVAKTPVGQIFPELIDHPRGWMIAKRKESLSKTKFHFDILLILKPDFSTWLEEELAIFEDRY
jgi:hypothetical protein